MVKRKLAGVCALLFTCGAQAAAPLFMSADWAAAACAAWNGDEQLVSGLGGDWIANDADRGYKIIHIYRDDCPDSPRVELTITGNDGRAECSYGGAVQHTELNSDVDYLMHGSDEHWVCMGKGEWGCGPMGAMATGKLKFEGPKMEAMRVMGPFEGFLLLTGQVESDRSSCP